MFFFLSLLIKELELSKTRKPLVASFLRNIVSAKKYRNLSCNTTLSCEIFVHTNSKQGLTALVYAKNVAGHLLRGFPSFAYKGRRDLSHKKSLPSAKWSAH